MLFHSKMVRLIKINSFYEINIKLLKIEKLVKFD